MSAMATCSSSLALSRGRHPLSSSLHTANPLYLKPQAVSFRNYLGLQRRRTTTVVACSEEDSSKGVLVDGANSNPKRGAASEVPPKRRKRGLPKKVTISEPGSASAAAAQESTSEEDEEEWDFFGELDRHMKNGHGASVETDQPHDVEGAFQNATSKMNGSSSKSSGINGSTTPGEDEESAAATRASSLGGPQANEEQVLREDDGDDGDDVDFDDPKYQQKPDWMQDEVWESIKSQLAANEDDEGQAPWVDEEDPNWPAEDPEDGWGFRTSQFFDKVSIKNDKSGGDEDDDDDEELRMNWENEADDWMILEITSSDWELSVFSNPSPLVVYVFARYGRRGLDSWKTLEQLETAVTKIWETNKAPLRAVKVDVGMEIDLGSALGIGKDDCPQLLFIKNGKGLYRLTEKRTSEELVQLMAHFFYNGAKPACLKTTASPETFNSVR